MFDLGWAELLIVAAIALFVIGPKDIPKIAYQIGKALRRLKYMQYALTSQFDNFMETAESKQTKPASKKEDTHDYDEADADAELIEMMPLPEERSINRRDSEAQGDDDKK
jgi:Tat protein translocase TatB subunit